MCLSVCLSVRTVFSKIFCMKKRVEKVIEEISAAWWWAVLISRVARGTKREIWRWGVARKMRFLGRFLVTSRAVPPFSLVSFHEFYNFRLEFSCQTVCSGGELKLEKTPSKSIKNALAWSTILKLLTAFPSAHVTQFYNRLIVNL